MDSLPQELVEIVLDFTNCHTDFTTMKILLFVCRAWYTLMTTKVIGNKPITIHRKYYKLANLMKLFKYNSKLTFCNTGKEGIYSYQLGRNPSTFLKELVISDSIIDFQWMRFSPALRKLTIENTHYRGPMINFGDLSQIHELTLNGITASASSHTEAFSGLKGLKILNLSSISNYTFQFRTISDLTNLEELNMKSVFSVLDIILIRDLPPSLRRLRVLNCIFMRGLLGLNDEARPVSLERLEIGAKSIIDKKIITQLLDRANKIIYS